MKPTYAHARRGRRLARYILSVFSAVLAVTAIAVSAVFLSTADIVHAEDADTFKVVFPTETDNYLQSDNPTLVSANTDYLIVYDKVASALFVRTRRNEPKSNYSYSLEIEDVEFVKTVGSTAFIYADGECYTIDLTDVSATPVHRELLTPQNANYFRSDGTYLYAKSSSGYITIYDENLEVAFGIDDYVYLDGKINVFAGMDPLAGENGLLYYFPSIFGNPFYIVYDPVTSEQKTNVLMDCLITEAYVGDIIYAQVSSVTSIDGVNDANPLIGIDKETGKVLFTSDIIPDSFSAFGNNLYTIEGKQIVTYTLDKSEEGEYIGFKKVSTISMTGSDLHHLNEPLDVIKFGNSLAVADSANKRVGFIDGASMMTCVNVESAPLRLTADTTGVYALLRGDKIIKIESGESTQTYNVPDALDIAYLDKLYILNSDGLYTALGGGIYKLATVEGGKRVSCAKDGTNVYVLTDSGIKVFAKDGTLMSSMEGEFESALDLAIDYAGQISILYSDKVENYKNSAGTLTLTGSTEFYCSTAHAKANSLCIDGLSLYFTADECLIGRTAVDAVTKDTFEAPEFITVGNENYHFAKLKEDVSAYVIPVDGRMEGIVSAPSDTLIVIDGVECITDDTAYALLNGEFFIIFKNDFNTVETESLSGEYAAIKDTVFYALPDVNNGKISISQGTRFTRLSDCADYDGGKWIRVTYEGKVYFVESEDCEQYIYVIPPEERTYGKAKATRVGGLVNVYAEPNTDSPAIMQIVDGTTVEVTEELDEYYEVIIDGVIGYMLKDEVEFERLTTVQIVAIVLAVFVVISGILVFIAIEVTKKKSEEKAKKKERT